jgi:replicative DNA helicase
MDLSMTRLREWTGPERERYDEACRRMRRMMTTLRVINDRKLTPELMRRHIDFLRHESSSEYTVVVIDSLHKLPFKDLSERRTGIDAWLRQLEAIRDELQVSFLVISELTRGGDGSYREEPHLGVFKGSGDIEYSADNAMVLSPGADHHGPAAAGGRTNTLWLVASREYSPGPVASYALDYPYWGFHEEGGRDG